MSEQTPPTGPDFSQGIDVAELGDAHLVSGRVGDDAVLLVKVDNDWLAVGAHCTHYSAPLADGLVDGDSIHCPWHHACFNLRSGAVQSPPALNPLPTWRVERAGQTLFVRDRLPESTRKGSRAGSTPERVVIVGAGAGGVVAAETLRAEGFDGSITLIDRDADAPYDRPNLSKDYLAGNAPEEWLPLRGPEFYAEHGVTLIRGASAASIDVAKRVVVLDDGSNHAFDALLLATGSRPISLPAPLAAERVHYLRTLADSRRIKNSAANAKTAVVIGASFIGLETAASLRALNVDVHIVAPDERPLGKVFGNELADFVRALHEEHGVRFHLGRTVQEIRDDAVTLSDGSVLAADLIVAGIGVRPNTDLAEAAGISCDNGILVDRYLETNVRGVFAAGDVARWQTNDAGDRARVEHWVHAERQAKTAARNMLGAHVPFTDVPFFWSQHYDVPINYTGLAPRWDDHVVDGNPHSRDCSVTYFTNGQRVAVATIGRDRDSLEAEIAMERINKQSAVVGA
jgi:apoptosis-inducing factor 3